MLKTLLRGDWQFVADRDELVDHAGCRLLRLHRPRRAPGARATIPSRRRSSRARGSTSRARRRKPGTSSSISRGTRPRLHGRRRLRPVSDQRSGAGRRGDRGARRAARFPDRRPRAARGADRRRVAGARARHAVPAVLLHHRRRAAAEGEGAGGRRGSRRRRRDARRAGGDREIPRRAARPGSLHRGARSAAAAALFDLVVAQGRCRPHVAHASTPCATTSTGRTRLGVASTFLAGRVEPRRPDQGLCAEGACLRPAGRSRRCRSS